MLKKITALLVFLGLAFVLLLLTTTDSHFEVRHRALLSGSQKQVWQVLAKVDEWPLWWPGIEQAKLHGPMQVGSEITLQMKGRPDRTPAQLTVVRPPQRLVWERPGVLNSRAGTRFILEGSQGQSYLTVENYIRGPQAFLARITGKDAFDKYQQQILQKLQLYLRTKQTPAGEKD